MTVFSSCQQIVLLSQFLVFLHCTVVYVVHTLITFEFIMFKSLLIRPLLGYYLYVINMP